MLITSTHTDGDHGNDNVDDSGDGQEDNNDDKDNDGDDLDDNDASNDCGNLLISLYRRYDRIASVADLILVSLLDANANIL